MKFGDLVFGEMGLNRLLHNLILDTAFQDNIILWMEAFLLYQSSNRCDETPHRIHRMHRTHRSPNNAVTGHDSV